MDLAIAGRAALFLFGVFALCLGAWVGATSNNRHALTLFFFALFLGVGAATIAGTLHS